MKRCPNGFRRNKLTKKCEKTGKRKRCPNGSRKNKKTKKCRKFYINRYGKRVYYRMPKTKTTFT